MATLRELVSKLTVDDRPATAALKRHDKQVKGTRRSLLELNAGLEIVQKGLHLLGTAARVASRAFDFLVVDVATTGDTFAKEAKKIGTTATSLQELSFAAERAGADQTKLVKAVSRMAKNLNDARAKNIGPFRDSLEQLGIPITEFDNLAPDEVFAKLADTIAGVEDPLVKAAIAQDIFGRSGRDLIPLLDEGSAGIEALRDRARELGLSMSDETAAASETFVDAMTDLKATVNGARFAIASELLPVMTDIIGRITDWTIANKELIRDKVTAFVRGFVKMIERGIPMVERLVKRVGGWIDAMGGLENAVMLVVGALGAMKLATIAAAGPWPALALAAGAAGYEIMEVMAGVDDSLQSAKFSAIELRSELARVQGNKQAMERRGTLAEQEADLTAQLVAGAETLSDADIRSLRERLTDVTLRRGSRAQAHGLVKSALERRELALANARAEALRGLSGARRKRAEQAIDAARARGGGTEAIAAAAEQSRGSARRPRRGRKAPRTTTAPALESGASSDELLALAAAAVPGADLGDLAKRKVPKVTAPVVTVTVNQTNIDLDVSSPITIEGVPGMSAEDVAGIVVRRQASALDEAVREAIEILQPSAEGV